MAADLSDATKDRIQADLWDHLRGRPASEFRTLADTPAAGDKSRYIPALREPNLLAVLDELTKRIPIG